MSDETEFINFKFTLPFSYDIVSLPVLATLASGLTIKDLKRILCNLFGTSSQNKDKVHPIIHGMNGVDHKRIRFIHDHKE